MGDIVLVVTETSSTSLQPICTVRKRKMDDGSLYLLLLRSPHELFNWLFSVDDDEGEVPSEGKLSWQVSYQRDEVDRRHRREEQQQEREDEDGNATRGDGLDKYKVRAKIEVSKDDVQKVLPIAKVIKRIVVNTILGLPRSITGGITGRRIAFSPPDDAIHRLPLLMLET
jgi:hypothetical protein